MTEGYELYLRALFSFATVLVLIGLTAYLLRKWTMHVRVRGGVRNQRRLGVVEVASVDQRRRLILVRRDDVEHLIMTGGPSDIVIESGIGIAQAVIEPATTAATAEPSTRPLAPPDGFRRELDQVRF